MIVLIKESSVTALNALSTMVLGELNDYVYAMQAAMSLKDLKALLPDDVTVLDERHFTIAIRENFGHIVASISAEINSDLDVVMTLQCYD